VKLEKRALPIIDGHEAQSSLHVDGTRKRIVTADVSGRYLRLRRITFALLIGLWAALPWIKIGGHPAVFLDIEARAFFLFGFSFNAQDVWLLFFLAITFAFGLVAVTAVFGRVWCGFACPQTVFLEAVFRPLERLIGGTREARLKGLSFPRKVLLRAAYLGAALLVAHLFVSYFVSLPRLFRMMTQSPSAHPEAFLWVAGLTGLFYFNFAWFREQFCVVMCPYGRLQSVLLDDHSTVIGYDAKRGEPRGKKGQTEGDCVDCNRCVVVCPTGIDIRNGLQLDCIACAQCIDACDDVMDRLERPRGLVRYDSLKGLRGEKAKLLRPRTIGYGVALVVAMSALFYMTRKREPFEANVLRLPGAPYTREAGQVRNRFEVHLVNKEGASATFDLSATSTPGYEVLIPMQHVELASQEGRRLPLFVSVPESAFVGERPVEVTVVQHSGARTHTRVYKVLFLGGAATASTQP
jgi:cytochrome c oxidase accessory protein FixG